jgi:5-methylcytosine-specific restriction endonuclease McrA
MPTKGQRMSKEAKRKISQAKRGKIRHDMRGKTLAEIYGPERAADILARRTKSIQHRARERWDQALGQNQHRRRSFREREWRQAVLERDGYTCQRCGAQTERLHAHHKQVWNAAPELRFDVSNGETLCPTCHSRTHAKIQSHCVICGKAQVAHGYCSKHYQRWKKYGDPFVVKNRWSPPRRIAS